MTNWLTYMALLLGVAVVSYGFATGGSEADLGEEEGISVKVVVDEVEHSRESLSDKLTKNFFSPNGIWQISDDGFAHIPYKYAQHTLGPINPTFMKKTFSEWEKNTCVRFREMDASESMKGNHMNIFVGKWCQANLGRLSWVATNVSMYEKCGQPGYIHEMGHALGLAHMHNRSDRDKYLQIVKDNIIPGRESAFKIKKTNNFDIDWDYTSVMLYTPYGFSKNGKLTMIPTDSRWGDRFGYPPHTSYMDTKIINRALKCDAQFLKKCGKTTDPCQNGGYMGPKCECLCPPGTEEDDCSKKFKSYNDAMLQEWHPDNRMLTTPGVVSSPNYPNTPTTEHKSLTILRAPHCKRVSLKFDEPLDLIYRRKYDNKCVYDYITFSSSVGDENPHTFCNKELPTGTIIRSSGSELFIKLRLQVANGFVRKGYKATWTTEDIPGCS